MISVPNAPRRILSSSPTSFPSTTHSEFLRLICIPPQKSVNSTPTPISASGSGDTVTVRVGGREYFSRNTLLERLLPFPADRVNVVSLTRNARISLARPVALLPGGCKAAGHGRGGGRGGGGRTVETAQPTDILIATIEAQLSSQPTAVGRIPTASFLERRKEEEERVRTQSQALSEPTCYEAS